MSSKLSKMERVLSEDSDRDLRNDFATRSAYTLGMALKLTTTTTTTTSDFRGRLRLG
ncbi:MAG: hypothetical protein AAF697_04335 [Pseudomonadota bacterium]